MSGPEEAARKTQQNEGDSESNERTKPEYIFHVRHESGGGRVYEGTFTNHILTNTQRAHVAVVAARMRQGMPHESMDPMVNLWLDKLAHMAVSMPQAERPEWAKDLGALYDDDVVNAIYEEVAQHEDTFFGRVQDQAGSTG